MLAGDEMSIRARICTPILAVVKSETHGLAGSNTLKAIEVAVLLSGAFNREASGEGFHMSRISSC